MPSVFKNLGNSGTGAIKLPIGTTAQQPGSPADGMLRYNTTLGRTEVRDQSASEFLPSNYKGVVASGGDTIDITQDGQRYRVHIFNSNDTLSVTKGGTLEYLVVGGGGGGGNNQNGSSARGGGGAGEFVEGTFDVTVGSYSAIIGTGGALGPLEGPSEAGLYSVFGGGTNLLSNGTFDSDTSGWTQSTGTWTVSSGEVSSTSTGGSLDGAITCEVGETYAVLFELKANFTDSQNGVYVRNSNLSSQGTELRVQDGSIGAFAFTFTATETTHYIRLYHGSNAGTITYDNVAVFNTNDNIIAMGGGAGHSAFAANGTAGANGGGGSATGTQGSAGFKGVSTAIFGFGNDGGNGSGNTNLHFAGGGGGAGAVGYGYDVGNRGLGGKGRMSRITGLDLFYAGGGGSGGDDIDDGGAGVGYNGGLGGGGRGHDADTVNLVAATPGLANTGGGGGGGGTRQQGTGREGGSGVVIVRYPLYNKDQPGTSYSKITNGLLYDLDFANTTTYKGTGSEARDTRGYETALVEGATYINPRTHRAAFNFDGVNDRINLGTYAGSFSGSMTFQVWYYAVVLGNGYIMSSWKSSEWRFNLIHNSSGNFVFTLRDATNTDKATTTSGTYPINAWYHITGVADASTGTVSVFVNSTDKTTETGWSGTWQSSTGSTYIGYKEDTGSYRQQTVATAKIYNRALTDAEVTQSFNYDKWRFGL